MEPRYSNRRHRHPDMHVKHEAQYPLPTSVWITQGHHGRTASKSLTPDLAPASHALKFLRPKSKAHHQPCPTTPKRFGLQGKRELPEPTAQVESSVVGVEVG